ncbi:MAG: hypothetical protein GY710_08100 [Desulfobacteraceae bacterium]|nr:hypothetical protein [Desulfobacteraceae bacterium]
MDKVNTQLIKNFAAVNGAFKNADIRAAFNLTSSQVSDVITKLLKENYIRRISYGLYRFCDVVKTPNFEINDKLWKAMKINNSFTAAQISRLAGSSLSHTYRQFSFYSAEGYIRQHGCKPTTNKRTEKVWRLTSKGKEKAQNPNIETFQPDPLVMAAVNLNRLVCSGVAVRDPEAAKQALNFVEQIKNGLEDVAASSQA